MGIFDNLKKFLKKTRWGRKYSKDVCVSSSEIKAEKGQPYHEVNLKKYSQILFFCALFQSIWFAHIYSNKKETSGLCTWHQASYYIFESCCISMTNKNSNTLSSGCVPQPKTKIICNIEKSRYIYNFLLVLLYFRLGIFHQYLKLNSPLRFWIWLFVLLGWP